MGHNVEIIEGATTSARYGTAAGIGLAAHVQAFLDQHDRLQDVPFSLPSKCFHVLDENLKTTRDLLQGYSLTSWDSMYYRLRANFDGFASSYYPQPPPRQSTDGNTAFHPGVRALSVHDAENSVRIEASNFITGESKELYADYVVVADGGNSTIRRQLEPTAARLDSGYMVWRGVAPVKYASDTIRGKLNGACAIYNIPDHKNYVIM